MKKSIITKGCPTIQKILDTYIDVYMVSKRPSQGGMQTAKSCCKSLSNFFGEMQYDEVMPLHIVEYVNQRHDNGIADNTIRREMSVFRAAVNKSLDYRLIKTYTNKGDYSNEYWIAQRLMESISKNRPKAFKRQVRPTYDNIDEILSVVENVHAWRLIWLATRIGYRQGEMLALEFSDLDLSEKELRLPDSKTDEPRQTPLYNELYIFFNNLVVEAKRKYGRDYRNELMFPISRHKLYRYWAAASRKAGLVTKDNKLKFHFHDLRKVAIRYIKEKIGITDRNIVADHFTGHHDMKIFEEIYNCRNADSYTYAKRLVMSK